ncbi:MAG TPA: iron-containing alcohol dehydrogenase [Candidatus Anoxymicrobiaceae bacterium]
MMYFFELKMPGKTLCMDGGARKLGKLVKRLGGTRILVVTDIGVRKVGLVDPVLAGLDRGTSSVAGIFDDVPSDPGFGTIERCAAMAREVEADCLISIGGGSSIDTAKATLIRLCETGDLREYEWNEYIASGPLLPHIAIPTTAGTGSESTHVAMITDEDRNRKLMYQGADLVPSVAVLDPQMTLSLPAHLTASTGMDALTHCIEAVHSIWHQPMTDGLAFSAIELIGTYLEQAYLDGSDVFARINMLLAATMGGTAASNSFIGIVHATGHPLGALFHIQHGAAVAVMLPYAMEMNLKYEGVPERYRRVAAALGLQVERDDAITASRKAVGRIRELIAHLGLPRCLSDLDITEDSLEALTDEAMEDRAMMVTPGNPGREDVAELFRKAL